MYPNNTFDGIWTFIPVTEVSGNASAQKKLKCHNMDAANAIRDAFQIGQRSIGCKTKAMRALNIVWSELRNHNRKIIELGLLLTSLQNVTSCEILKIR